MRPASFRANVDIRDAIAIGLILLVATTDRIWNAHADIDWRPDLGSALLPWLWVVLIIAACAAVRPMPRITEAALFLALWFVFGIVAGPLSYLAATVDFPLRDAGFARLDSIIGFDWRAWCDFANASSWFRAAQNFAYRSYYWQPFASVAVFAIWAPGRNRETFTAAVIGSMITIAVSAFLPGLGPAHAHGVSAPWEGVVNALRSGSHAPLVSYIGVVTFPSFHAVIAVLMIIAHRGIWTAAPALLLNSLMLVSLPLYGDHYLIDVLSGALVAAFSFLAARTMLSLIPKRA